MQTSRSVSCFSVLLLLCAAVCILLPATAAPNTVTIAYRGSGGSYIGDTIIFDGLNTAGNTTVVKISGPNLPAEGVPLYDLNGVPGSGNTVPVDSRTQWVYAWDMSRIDTSRLQTARYFFTAWDKADPQVTATTSLVLKRPEYYLTAQPTTARIGEYIELKGMAERGVTYIRLDVSDPAGTVVRTFMAPVSGMGFFQHGFHADVPPGQYTVTGSNPSLKESLTLVLTVSPPAVTATTTAGAAGTTSEATPAETGAGTGAATPAPTQAGVFSTTLVLALIGAGSAALWFGRQ
jgi:hypothetical protein